MFPSLSLESSEWPSFSRSSYLCLFGWTNSNMDKSLSILCGEMTVFWCWLFLFVLGGWVFVGFVCLSSFFQGEVSCILDWPVTVDESMILPPPPEFRGDRHMPSWLVYVVLGIRCMLGKHLYQLNSIASPWDTPVFSNSFGLWLLEYLITIGPIEPEI